MITIVAGLDMSTKCWGPAELDRRHDAAFDAAKMTVMGLGVNRAVAAEDVRHFERGTHGSTQAGGMTWRLKRSSGLCVAEIVDVATWV